MSISRHSRAIARWRRAEIERIARPAGVAIRVAGDARRLRCRAAIWLRLKRGLLARWRSFHADNPDLPGIGLERLRLQLEPRLPAPAFLPMLQALARMHEIALDGAWVRLAGHEVRLTPQRRKALGANRSRCSPAHERFRPPRVRDIAGALGDARSAMCGVC